MTELIDTLSHCHLAGERNPSSSAIGIRIGRWAICGKCGSKRVDVRPNWKEQSPSESLQNVSLIARARFDNGRSAASKEKLDAGLRQQGPPQTFAAQRAVIGWSRRPPTARTIQSYMTREARLGY